MSVQPTSWQPFASDEARLEYLKDHKLTPKSAKAPKPLFYSGIDAEGTELCTAEGVVDDCTLVIKVGEEYHCIHPDYLAEMQKGTSVRRGTSTRSAAGKSPKSKATGIDFVAIDFETATGSYDSACSLGIAVVREMQVAETWYHLIQPPMNRYEEGNVRVHGITPAQTAGEQSLNALWPEISRYFDGNLIVAHNARFDVSVLRKSLSGSERIPNFKYADTLTMVRNVVPGRHGLDACCEYFGIVLEHHHNALDDAVACANVAICCAKAAGCDSFSAYLRQERISRTDFHRKDNRFNRYAHKAVKLSEVTATVDQFDLTHPLYQKNVVFTGDLSIDRADAVQLAVNRGALVKSGVSGKTDFLVIGTHGQPENARMSSKEKRARELQQAGKEIRLLSEEEFLKLVNM